MLKVFELRGKLDKKQRTLLEIGGLLFMLLIWYLITVGESPLISRAILPSPLEVFYSFGDLYRDNELIKNTCRSIGLNLAGYFEAIIIAIPLGFLIGLIPFFRGTLQGPIDALRFLPLPAAMGLFIAWFGIGIGMKINFLAFGILIYLVPIIVQRIDEVKSVYVKTVYTLGATNWDTIKSVYIPSVLSRISDDIRVLTAISWTYIIIAETIGGGGGIGSLIWRQAIRQGRMDKNFALLILIMFIGIFQDKLLKYLDKVFFPHKYQEEISAEAAEKKGLLDDVLDYGMSALIWIMLGIYFLMLVNEFTGIFSDIRLFDYLFGETAIVIHFVFLMVAAYKIKEIWNRYF